MKRDIKTRSYVILFGCVLSVAVGFLSKMADWPSAISMFFVGMSVGLFMALLINVSVD